MEQSPKVCSRCQQANFPIAEYCRHCGEPLFEVGSISRASLPGRLFGHLADGMAWAVAELQRWWEIGGLTVRSKALERRRAVRFAKAGAQTETADAQSPDRERLMALSGEWLEADDRL
ncbi:MAG TPA: zinc ribbon domain-containing protein, partial [Candidatus Ozemobacteraceae bacterium]|nr:zinc ribbon domain-containing protein [Candidatus Ozemobacteraceae bacterium]